MSSDALKPCPFCGKPVDGEASVCDYIILCRPCGLKMRRNSEHRDTAISAWNRRAPSPAFNALVKECRELLAQVRGECPSLLNEDSGGDARLSLAIDEALAAAEKELHP